MSTADANCDVFFGPAAYPSWAAFAAANPTYRVANGLPFVIAEVQTGNPITLYDVTIAKS